MIQYGHRTLQKVVNYLGANVYKEASKRLQCTKTSQELHLNTNCSYTYSLRGMIRGYESSRTSDHYIRKYMPKNTNPYHIYIHINKVLCTLALT